MGVILQTTNLVKRYGKRLALDGFSLSIPQFSVMGLVGPNGAGKTTWMLTVAGFLKPTSGEINLLGNGPFNADTHSGRITILPQDSELPLEGHAMELMVHYGLLQGLNKKDARDCAVQLLEAVNLGDRLDAPIKTLSHGMRKRVMMAQCFIGHPELILLDEPLSGLDPREISRMRDFILARRGKQTIVISSHNLNDIETLCTHVALIDHGKVTKSAPLGAYTASEAQFTYKLTGAPTDIAAFNAALPGAQFSWDDAKCELTCSYAQSGLAAAAVNAKLLPLIIAQTGLLSITQGESLEKVYLATPDKK